LAPYHAPEELSKEQVKKWLKMAMCSEFNIFSDTNRVIALLCYELLRKIEDEKENL
tara:strand:+ start:420 stop:587 length:168 start_codon:yes stop_codon:yes gene_type:complete